MIRRQGFEDVLDDDFNDGEKARCTKGCLSPTEYCIGKSTRTMGVCGKSNINYKVTAKKHRHGNKLPVFICRGRHNQVPLVA